MESSSTDPDRFPRPAGEEQVVFEGKIFDVVQQPMEVAKEKVITFEKARRAPGVRLIVFSKDGSSVLLTREHRSEVGGYDYRLPGGKVFDALADYNAALEAGSDIAEVARAKAIAEGHEEAGLEIRELTPVHVSKLGATVEWDLHYFKVTDYEDHPEGQNLEDGEDITREWVPVEKVKNMILDGEMSEERSAMVLLRFLDF